MSSAAEKAAVSEQVAIDVPGILRKANAPSRLEFDLHDIPVTGTLPDDLNGIFYRVASDRQWPAHLGPDFPFNEDGMVYAVRFKDGRASIKQRYVRTDRWKAEQAAGRSLFGRYRDRASDDPSVHDVERTIANTSPILHAGVLLSTKEDGPAYGMDPLTLETFGRWDFHGTFKKRVFTAHPRIDSETGEMIAFGYADQDTFSTDLTCYWISPEGQVTKEVEFHLPYMNMQHDMCITRDYIVWAVSPLIGTGAEKLAAGERLFRRDSSLPLYLVVLPRSSESGSDVRWFKTRNSFVSHNMNAFNEGSVISFDTCLSPGNGFPFFPELGKPFDFSTCVTKLTRIVVDYDKGGETWEQAAEFSDEQRLSEFVGEFPRTDDRFQGMPYRHGWMLRFQATRNAFAHVDLEAGTTTVFEAPVDVVLQEPIFVPRSPTSAEGDGYILQVFNRTSENRTDICLFEATDIAKGPICSLQLPLRLRAAWHGFWADASLLPLEAQ